MTQSEMVTTFSLRDGSEMVKVWDLLKAINEFCGNLAEEYQFSEFRWEDNPRVPKDFWSLVAFSKEGTNEGYYVHIGAIMHGTRAEPSRYIGLGCAKTYSPDSAYELARQASRFLAATLWN